MRSVASSTGQRPLKRDRASARHSLTTAINAPVEYPDRFETAHVRHEDVDEHEIEAGVFQCPEPGFAAVGYRRFKAMRLETDLDGRAHQRIVIDDENTCHVSPRKQIVRIQSDLPRSQSVLGA
jgi:hypothetical protein